LKKIKIFCYKIFLLLLFFIFLILKFRGFVWFFIYFFYYFFLKIFLNKIINDRSPVEFREAIVAGT
ncbi:hypothetical protein ACFWDG_20805, partial [Peribacillus sp. NPDC060186]